VHPVAGRCRHCRSDLTRVPRPDAPTLSAAAPPRTRTALIAMALVLVVVAVAVPLVAA
jgi:hypothetical protein